VGVYAEESLQGQEEGWVMEPSMVTKLIVRSASAVNGKIYVLGGKTNNNSTVVDSDIDIFDTKTQTWTSGAPMNTARANFATVTIGNYIYAISGEIYNSKRTNTMERYDTISNTWTMLEPLSIPRHGHRAVSVGSKIYVIGGYDSNSNYLNSVEIYDTETHTWSKGLPMPTARMLMGAVYVDGKIYVIGGVNKNEYFTKVEIFDLSSGTWSEGEPMPTKRGMCSSALVGNEIFVFGGNSNSTNVDVYDIKTNKWRQESSLNIARGFLDVVNTNGRIYAIGGDSNFTMESLKVNDSTSTEKRLFVLLNIGETVQLSITKNLSDNANFTWRSINESIATVDAHGRVIAVAEGDTEIYAENADGTFKEYISIKVVAGSADETRLATYLRQGEKIRLYLSDDPSTVTWRSMDESIATISETGQVTAIKNGLVIIQGELEGETYLFYVRVVSA